MKLTIKLTFLFYICLPLLLKAQIGTSYSQINIKVSNTFLNFPVDDTGPISYLIIRDENNNPLYDFRISLTNDEPVFYASLDLSMHIGKTFSIEVDTLAFAGKISDIIFQSDEIPDSDNIYRKQFRPQFHYSPRVGWVNDPNGLVYYNGLYHMFYQYNPYGKKWNNMHWGYATSKDLVHWKDHGVGLYPEYQKDAYSGSGTVDWNNTSGLQTSEHPPILLYYTVCGQRFQERSQRKTPQRLAYSADGGKSWKKYPKPVIEPFAKPDGTYYVDRDPIVRWYEPGEHWVMMLFIGNNTFRVFQSKNAIDWKAVSDLKVPGHNECPDFFQLEVENEPGVKKWIFISGSGKFWEGDCASYAVGNFDGKQFVPEQKSLLMDQGIGNYSTQTFSDAPDGRRIYLAWYTRNFGSVGYPGMPSNAQFRVPWELSLYKSDEGYRLRRLPVDELNSLRGKKHQYVNLEMFSGEKALVNISHDLLDIEAEVILGKTGSIGLNLLGMEIKYNIEDKSLHAFKKQAVLEPVEGKIKFRILLDRNSIEIFANDGTFVMSGLFMPELDKPAIELFSKGDSGIFKKLDVYEMKSIWE